MDYAANIMVRRFRDRVNTQILPGLILPTTVSRTHIKYFVANQMSSSVQDEDILSFLYSFIDDYKRSRNEFHGAVVLFRGPDIVHEQLFQELFQKRLFALTLLDAGNHIDGPVLTTQIHTNGLLINLKEERIYVNGFHVLNRRKWMRFPFPALFFNTHTPLGADQKQEVNFQTASGNSQLNLLREIKREIKILN